MCIRDRWYWAGPDAYIDAAAAEAAGKTAGFLFQKGALDFAGGTVVHINAAVAGLVGAFMIGKRVGYGKESMAPHSLTSVSYTHLDVYKRQVRVVAPTLITTSSPMLFAGHNPNTALAFSHFSSMIFFSICLLYTSRCV